jgi:hypothetical protein
MNVEYILRNEYPNEPWAVVGDPENYSNLKWGSSECATSGIHYDMKETVPKPTESQLQILWNTKYEREYENSLIAIKRFQEYPPINDLIVALWEKIIEGRDYKCDELQNQRTQIKEKYPKVS